MFIQSVFKSVNQYSSGVVTGAGTIAITSINTRNAAIIFNGSSSLDTSGFPNGAGLNYLQLTNATTVSYFSYSNSAVINFTVIEFYGGFLRQAVQYGIGTMSGGSITATDTITTVGAKAFPMYLGIAESTGTAQADMASVTGRVTLLSTTQVKVDRVGNGGISAPDTCKIAYCVVDPR